MVTFFQNQEHGSLLSSLFCISIRGSPHLTHFSSFFTGVRPASPGSQVCIARPLPRSRLSTTNPAFPTDIFFFTGTITSINFLIFTIRAGDFKTCLLIADSLTPSVLRSKSQRMYKERSKKVSGNIDFDTRSSFQVPIRTHFWVVHKGTGYGPSHW